MATIRWPCKLNWQRASEQARRARRAGKGRKRRLRRRAALRLLLLRRPGPRPSVPAAAGSPSSLEKVADLGTPPRAANLFLLFGGDVEQWQYERGGGGRVVGGHSTPLRSTCFLLKASLPLLRSLVCSANSTDGRKREGRRSCLSFRPCPNLIVSFSLTSVSLDFFSCGPAPTINQLAISYFLAPTKSNKPTTVRRPLFFFQSIETGKMRQLFV